MLKAHPVIFPVTVFFAAAAVLTLSIFYNPAVYSNKGKCCRTIVSISPSLTKIAIDLGAGNSVIGITSSDTSLKGKAAVIGTLMNPSIEEIIRLKPDAVVCCEEDSAVQHIDQFASAGIRCEQFPIVKNFEDSLSLLTRMGRILGKEKEAHEKEGFYRNAYYTKDAPSHYTSVLFLLSDDPVIAASGSSFLGALIADAGGRSAAADASNPYPVLSREFVVRAAPELVITTSKDSEIILRKRFTHFPSLPFLRKERIITVDPDTACLYDPEDMLVTKNTVAEALKGLQ